DPQLRLIRHDHNRGKGAAVRTGVLQTVGNWILITDADLATPLDDAQRLFDAALHGAAVVYGSRALPDSEIQIAQKGLRPLLGRIFNSYVRTILRLSPLRDTQCGFKLL